MASTLLLDQTTWDLVIDSAGNIAVASEPYSLAQDAASAIKTFLGECYWDTTIGVPYLTVVFRGAPPSIATLRQMFVNAALTVPGVFAAQVFFSQVSGRRLVGQVQVQAAPGTQFAAINFNILNPQGGGGPPVPPVTRVGQLDFSQPGNPLLPSTSGI